MRKMRCFDVLMRNTPSRDDFHFDLMFIKQIKKNHKFVRFPAKQQPGLTCSESIHVHAPSYYLPYTSTPEVALVVILDLKNKCSSICVVPISSQKSLWETQRKLHQRVFGQRFDSITWRVNGKQCHLSFITQTYEMTYNKHLKKSNQDLTAFPFFWLLL